MTEIPAAAPPIHIMTTWAGIGVVGLLAVGLVLLALIAVVTTLRAAGRPLIPRERILTVAAMLVWIVPALVLVVYMARGAVHVASVPSPIFPVEVRTRDEMRNVPPIQEIQERSRLASFKTETIRDGSALQAEAASLERKAYRSSLQAE